MVTLTIRHLDDTFKSKGETVAEALGNLKFPKDFIFKSKMYVDVKQGSKQAEDVLFPKEIKRAFQSELKRELVAKKIQMKLNIA